MGLKSGSRNSGLDDSQTSREENYDEGSRDRKVEQKNSPERSSKPETETQTSQGSSRPTEQSLPYKLRREKVNAGREQVPFFLRKEVIDAEDDLQDTLEEELDENVYKSDYREAAMIVAQRKPELVAEVLREWGYDLDTV